MLTGPEAMPVFSDGVDHPEAKRDIIAYVTQTRSEPNPGGFSLGRTGPVTEGLVIWLGGLRFPGHLRDVDHRQAAGRRP